MNDRTQKLLAAHRDFEIARLRPDRINETIAKEIHAALDAGGSIPVEQILSREDLANFIVREFQTAPVSEDGRAFLTKAGENIRKLLQQSPEKVEDLTTRAVHDRWVEILISSRDMRNNLAHDLVQSPLFRKLLSDILYQAIRSFLSEDNALAKSIPGMSSLFKFGQNLVSQTLPGLDENMGRVIRDFVGKNMEGLSRYAESILTAQMDEKSIRELGEHFWNDYKEQKVSKFAADMQQVKSEDAADAVSMFWEHFRKTELGANLVRSAVNSWFDHYGPKSIETALADAGMNRDRLISAATTAAGPVIARAVESGAVEKYLDQKLKEFYNSPEAQQLIG